MLSQFFPCQVPSRQISSYRPSYRKSSSSLVRRDALTTSPDNKREADEYGQKDLQHDAKTDR